MRIPKLLGTAGAAALLAATVSMPVHAAGEMANTQLKDASGKDIALGRVVTWTTSDPSVASVTPKTGTYSATVKGNKEGTATISATSEGKSASVTVTVKH